MSLCVALGYCRKDREQAVRWLESVKQLGALREHRLFLMPSFDCEPILDILPFTGLTDLRRVASEWSATASSADASGPNSVFRTFARYFRDNKLGPWFYCEPDCILLTPDALDRLEAEYRSARAPFMGVYIDRPIPRLNGTMICPQDAANIASIALPMRTPDNRLEIAFDVACAQDIMPRAHRTNLIQNVYGSVPFTSREDFDARVSREAVCYHSEKSGTIFQYLGGAVHAEPLADGSQSADSVRLTEADPPAQTPVGYFGPMLEAEHCAGMDTSHPELGYVVKHGDADPPAQNIIANGNRTGKSDSVIESEKGVWWCNSHERETTHVYEGEHCCDPTLGGRTIPCRVIFATIEIQKPWKELTAEEKTERRRQQMAVARASRGKTKKRRKAKR